MAEEDTAASTLTQLPRQKTKNKALSATKVSSEKAKVDAEAKVE